MNRRIGRMVGVGVAFGVLGVIGACKSSTDAGAAISIVGPPSETIGQTSIFTFPNLTGATCVWKSSNEAVATVTLSGATDGDVTGVSIGTATMSVTCTASTGTTHGSETISITAAPNIDGTYTTNFISSSNSCVVPATGVPFLIVNNLGYFSGNPGFSGPVTLTETFTTNTATVSGIFTATSNPAVFGGGCTGIPSISFSLTFNMQSGAGSGDLGVTYPGKSATSVGVILTGKGGL